MVKGYYGQALLGWHILKSYFLQLLGLLAQNGLGLLNIKLITGC